MALDLSALRRIIADENRLLTGADIPAEYQSDVLGRVHGSAEALAFPLSTEEVSALLRYAHKHRVPARRAARGRILSALPCRSRAASSSTFPAWTACSSSTRTR